MSDEKSRLLDVADLLFKQAWQLGLQDKVRRAVPVCVMFGQQSTGKSAVVRRISGVDIQSNSAACTRVKTRVTMRPSEAPRLVAVSALFPNGVEEPVPITDGEGACFSRAQDKVLDGASFSEHGLVKVDVAEPGAPTVTFVDLPGLYETINADEEAEQQMVERMVLTAVGEPGAFVLHVVPMDKDVRQSKTWRLVKELGAAARSAVVFTHADKVNEPQEVLRRMDEVVNEIGVARENIFIVDARAASPEAEMQSLRKVLGESWIRKIEQAGAHVGCEALKAGAQRFIASHMRKQMQALPQLLNSEMAARAKELEVMGTEPLPPADALQRALGRIRSGAQAVPPELGQHLDALLGQLGRDMEALHIEPTARSARAQGPRWQQAPGEMQGPGLHAVLEPIGQHHLASGLAEKGLGTVADFCAAGQTAVDDALRELGVESGGTRMEIWERVAAFGAPQRVSVDSALQEALDDLGRGNLAHALAAHGLATLAAFAAADAAKLERLFAELGVPAVDERERIIAAMRAKASADGEGAGDREARAGESQKALRLTALLEEAHEVFCTRMQRNVGMEDPLTVLRHFGKKFAVAAEPILYDFVNAAAASVRAGFFDAVFADAHAAAGAARPGVQLLAKEFKREFEKVHQVALENVKDILDASRLDGPLWIPHCTMTDVMRERKGIATMLHAQAKQRVAPQVAASEQLDGAVNALAGSLAFVRAQKMRVGDEVQNGTRRLLIVVAKRKLDEIVDGAFKDNSVLDLVLENEDVLQRRAQLKHEIATLRDMLDSCQ